MQKMLLFLYDDMAEFEIMLAAYMLSIDGIGEIVPIGYSDTVKSKIGIEYKIRTSVRDALNMDDAAGLLITDGVGDFIVICGKH